MNGIIEWEEIKNDHQSGHLYRAAVVGGWLIKQVDDVQTRVIEGQDLREGYEFRSSICFIPDQGHHWAL